MSNKICVEQILKIIYIIICICVFWIFLENKAERGTKLVVLSGMYLLLRMREEWSWLFLLICALYLKGWG